MLGVCSWMYCLSYENLIVKNAGREHFRESTGGESQADCSNKVRVDIPAASGDRTEFPSVSGEPAGYGIALIVFVTMPPDIGQIQDFCRDFASVLHSRPVATPRLGSRDSAAQVPHMPVRHGAGAPRPEISGLCGCIPRPADRPGTCQLRITKSRVRNDYMARKAGSLAIVSIVSKGF